MDINNIIFFICFLSLYYIFSKIVTIDNQIYLKENKGRNLVSDIEGNVYEVTNSNYYLFYRSAEIVNQLKTGVKLKIYGYGIRIPFLNVYPKIIGIKPYR